ncbi:hypothetical protein L915_12911 [Phytophthora nicotianae]|uniref:Uncharacterized protein n=1 Tax=Phytophthora nicotianae TaxID=4792 RepID=W2INN4_PHYNI|nr:hypothetical protein L915_12911 [Phytophthora nicotianae]ETL35008.1 hypothetical protein L916_12819 [Phytophthora nicotianae]
MGTLLFAIDEHPDVGQDEVRSGRTRAKRRNTKRKRRWTELQDGEFEMVDSVQGKSGSLGGLTATRCDALGGSIQGKSETVEENESEEPVEADDENDNEEPATADEPAKPGETDAAEDEEKAPAVVSEPAVDAEVTERDESPGNAVQEGQVERVRTIPAAVERQVVPLSAGRTTSAKRRKRRAEHEVAAGRGILVTELALRREARAKVLRTRVRHLIEELRIPDGLEQPKRQRREAQIAAETVKRAEVTKKQKVGKSKSAAKGIAADKSDGDVPLKDTGAFSTDEWLEEVARFEEEAPEELIEDGSLAEIRAARRKAEKKAKRFRFAKRLRRLQRWKELSGSAEPAKKNPVVRKKPRRTYEYKQSGCYGDVGLRDDGNGKQVRVAPLRAVGSDGLSCLPTALLALTRKHTQEVRLDSCAQYSVAGEELKKYGRCITRNAPVDIVEGFGGGISRVLGIWRFVGTTQYQQRIQVDALLVEGQGDELLVGEDWMVQHQIKMDFCARELKYVSDTGEKVIWPFTCHGVSSLQPRKVMVRLVKTRKLANSTSNVVHMRVDAEDGTEGIFIPKPTHRRHLMLAPTADTVKNGMVRISVMNVEGRREKLPAREALGTWVPVTEDMQLLK